MRQASATLGLLSNFPHPSDRDSDPAEDQQLDELVHRADLDGLIRLIDARCELRDWEGVHRVRDRCRAAASTGRQLWPAAILAQYRVTLWGPAALAAVMVDDAVGMVSVGAASIGTGVTGPLTEVIAQHHQWSELSPHLNDPIARAYVLHERSLRGEEIPHSDAQAAREIIEIPVPIASWEPAYLTASYRDSEADFAAPPIPPTTQQITVSDTLTEPHNWRVEDDHVIAVREAFTALVMPWISQSNGRCELVCAEGGTGEVMTVLKVAGNARIAPLPTSEALRWLHWAGSNGGAHGRRPGAAAGRDSLWWLLGTLGELTDHWPPKESEVIDLLADLQWFWWDTDQPSTGWNLRLLCQDAPHGVTWAFAAHDAV